MMDLIKFILELLRIMALLALISSIANYIFVNWLHLAKSDIKLVFLNVVLLVLFTLWYRKIGQFSGWYPRRSPKR